MTGVLVEATFLRTIYYGTGPSAVRMRGSLRIESDTIVLDYRESWRRPSDLRRMESQLLRATVPCASLADIEIRRGLFGRRRIILRAIEFEALRGWPATRADVCRLKVVKDGTGGNSHAASELALAVAESHLRQLERANDETISIPRPRQ